MKNKKENFLIYLEGRKFNDFVNFITKNKQISIIEMISILTKTGINENNFLRLRKLAEYIFIEISGRNFGEQIHFEIDKRLEYFQELMYYFNEFTALKISYKKWENLANILIEMLNDFIKTNDFSYKQNPKFKDFLKEKERIISEIRKDPEMNQKYFDFLNGAL